MAKADRDSSSPFPLNPHRAFPLDGSGERAIPHLHQLRLARRTATSVSASRRRYQGMAEEERREGQRERRRGEGETQQRSHTGTPFSSPRSTPSASQPSIVTFHPTQQHLFDLLLFSSLSTSLSSLPTPLLLLSLTSSTCSSLPPLPLPLIDDLDRWLQEG
jgi:hypothetical protein